MNAQTPPPLIPPKDGEDVYERPLNDQEKALREIFVNEYLKDFNGFNAALRCGFAAGFALYWATTFLKESYVQRRIAELTRTSTALSPADQDKADRALVEHTLREAMQNGQYATRVSAVKAFNELKGWTKHDDSGQTVEQLADLFREFATKAPV